MIGTFRPMSTQPTSLGCRCSFQVSCAAPRRSHSGTGSLRAPEERCELVRADDRVGGDVEGAAGRADDREPVRLRDVVRVDGLEAEPRRRGHERDPSPLQQPGRQEGPGEEPALAGRRAELEDQAGPQADDPHGRVLELEAVEQPLDLGLVPRVVARADPVDGPALVDRAILGPGRVGADGRGVDEARDAGGRDGLEHARRAVDVRPANGEEVVRRLDQPRELDDAVRAGEERRELVAGDVGGGPLDLRELELGEPPGDAEDRVDRGLVGERPEQARAGVAGRADDDDAHYPARSPAGMTPSSSTSVKNAFAYGEWSVRRRRSSQSTCSRSARETSRTLS